MKERRQLFALNLALLLLLTLLPLPAFGAEKTALASNQILVGGEILTPESGVSYSGQGWTFRKSGQNKLTLDDNYDGGPIQTAMNLTITLEGAATVTGGISAGYLTLSCNDPAAGLMVTNSAGPAIQASQLKLSFNCGTLTAFGTMALDVSTTLTLPTVEPFDEASTNVIQLAGDTAETAVSAAAYSGEPFYHWSLTECEIVFSPNGANWPEDLSAYRMLVPYGESCSVVFPAAPSHPGYIFQGWSILPSNGVNFYQPGDTLVQTPRRAYLPFYAGWTEAPVPGVVYHGSGALSDTATMLIVAGTAGESVDLSDQGFAASPNRFSGWSLSPVGEPLIQSAVFAENEILDLYAVWTYSSSAAFQGSTLPLTTGPLILSGTVRGLPADSGSGIGWSGTPAGMTLTSDYTGSPIETDYDLYLHIDGQVTLQGMDGPAIRTGGKLLLDFTAGSTLTLQGAGSSPAIQAEELRVAAPGCLTATGGTGAPALEITGACQLSCSTDTFIYNNILAGSDADTAADNVYSGQHYLSVQEEIYDGSRVILDGNGGSRNGETAVLAAALPENNAGFTRTGYRFLGWGLTADAETPLTVLPEQEGLLRIYALWEGSAIYLHTKTGIQTLLLDEDGMANLPAYTNGFWYTNAFNGWNTEPDGSGTWYARGARILADQGMDLYALGTDLSQDHIWLSACFGAFEGQTFHTAATSLEENEVFFPSVLPVKANMEAREMDVLAWWWDHSIYVDGGYSPRSAIVPGSTIHNWPSRTLFRGILDVPNTSGEAWTVQDLQGGVTADGYPLVVSYASLGDLKLIGADGVFKEGSTLAGWNTEPDGSGTFYEPGTRFLFEDYAFHWDEAPRKLYAVWDAAETYTVTLEHNGDTTTISVGANTSCTLPELSQGDLRFDGWLDESGVLYAAGSQLIVSGDTRLSAQWTEPDLILPIPTEMQQGGTLFAALYQGDRLLTTTLSEPDAKLPLYDVPGQATKWRLFCLDDLLCPMSGFSEGEL